MGNFADPEDEDTTPSLKRKNKDDGTCAAVPVVATPSTSSSRGVSTQLLVQQDSVTSSAPDEPVSSSVKSDDIQLSIRMPSGNRLEMKLGMWRGSCKMWESFNLMTFFLASSSC